jgi:DDE superfamily endonuclease/Homeodomain-like domain
MDRYVVKLTEEEKPYLTDILKRGKHTSAARCHAQILLLADEIDVGPYCTNEEIAEASNSCLRTISRVRKKFVEEGLEACLTRRLFSKKRPTKLGGEGEPRLIALCCSTPPEGRARWTLNLLTDKLIQMEIVESISRSTVGRTLDKNELKPWQKKEWCIPPESNAEFVCAMEDILEVYQRPYNADIPVLCVDESPKQLVKETKKPIAPKPGVSEKFDTYYERNGAQNIFISFEPLVGKRDITVTDHRTKIDFANFIKDLVDIKYAEAKKIVLVCDNLNTHTGGSFYEAFSPEEARRLLNKIEFHYTPKHGSWLNMAEIELSHLSRQCLDRRIADKATLIKEVESWLKQRNKEASVVDWRFTAADARIKLKRLYPILSS